VLNKYQQSRKFLEFPWEIFRNREVAGFGYWWVLPGQRSPGGGEEGEFKERF